MLRDQLQVGMGKSASLRRTGLVAGALAVAVFSSGVPAAAATAVVAVGRTAISAEASSVHHLSSSSRPAPVDPAPSGTAAPHTRTAAQYVSVRNPGLKAMLSAEDDNRAAPGPALSALCQNFIGKPNPYAKPAPDVDMIMGDAIARTGSQTGCSTAQNETTIAVNPENPKNLVSGANDYRVFNTREQRNDGSGWAYTSFDGGQTWKNIKLPHLTVQTGGKGAFAQMDSAGDPAIAFGPHNVVYYANIVFSRGAPTTGGTQAANGISLNVSHDGGLHWDEPLLVQANGVDRAGNLVISHVFNDKVWLAASPNDGHVYLSWTRFQDAVDGSYLESPIVVAASANYGRSFAPYRRVDTTLADFKSGGQAPYSQGSNPKVAKDGTLYVAYEGTVCKSLACDQFGNGDRDVTVVATSKDRGRTFTRTIIGTNFDFPLNTSLGTATLTGENFRINSFPQLAYDTTTGVLALTWADDRNGAYDSATGNSVKTNGDNVVAGSVDGRHWTRPVTIGTAQDEVLGAIAVQRGVVALTSYTRHYDAAGIKLDYAYWTSTDLLAGSTLPIHRATTQSSDPQIQFVGLDSGGNPVQGTFIGDYTSTALGSDLRLHPCWTDFRGKPGRTGPNQDSYTRSIQLGLS